MSIVSLQKKRDGAISLDEERRIRAVWGAF
jgi:hypothetical protein